MLEKLLFPIGAGALALAVAVIPVGAQADDDLIAKGKLIFEETAGGIGCASCHSMDATGDVGPNIQGRVVADIEYALSSVEDMAFLELSADEISAVEAYLATF